VFNVLQDHGIVQPTPDGKAIWKATITSDAGWSHTFTLLRLAPSLIWEGDDRPPPFAGTVTVVQEEGKQLLPHRCPPYRTWPPPSLCRRSQPAKVSRRF